ITRYRSRVIRRFGDDFARFQALRAARYGVDLSEVDPLPAPTDLLNNLAWAIALHLYADFPECFPDFTRDLLASVVPQLEGFLCPEDYAALTSRLHDSLQDGSAG